MSFRQALKEPLSLLYWAVQVFWHGHMFYTHELSCTLISCFLHWCSGAPSGRFHVTVTATVHCIAMQLKIFFFCTIRILNEWMNNQPIKVNKSPCLTFSEDKANNYPFTEQSVILKTQVKFCVYNMLVFISRDSSLKHAQRFPKKGVAIFHITMWW